MAKDKTKTVPPPERTPAEVVTDPKTEFVAGVLESAFIQGERGLPETIDDAEKSFGTDIYDRMMRDGILIGALNQLVAKILEDGVTIAPAHEEPSELDAKPEEKAKFERSEKNAAIIRRAFKDLSFTGFPFMVVLADMVRGACSHGHKFAEPVYAVRKYGPDKGKLLIDRLKVKPRKNYRFVTDEFQNFIGVMAVVPGANLLLRQGLLPSVQGVTNIVARERCFVLSFDIKDNDPRGCSLIRAAYDPWKRKQYFKPAEVKFIDQFGGGLISVVLGEDTPSSIAVTKADGSTEVVTTYEGVGRIAKNMSSGGYGIFPQGVDFNVHVPDADGQAFDGAYDRANKEIVMAILTSSRILLESKRNSQADAGGAENLLDSIVTYFRGVLCEAIQTSLVYPMILWNEGDEDAREYLPRVVMAKTAKPDFAANAGAVAKLYSSGALTDEMLPDAHREHLNLKWKGAVRKKEEPANAQPKDNKDD